MRTYRVDVVETTVTRRARLITAWSADEARELAEAQDVTCPPWQDAAPVAVTSEIIACVPVGEPVPVVVPRRVPRWAAAHAWVFVLALVCVLVGGVLGAWLDSSVQAVMPTRWPAA